MHYPMHIPKLCTPLCMIVDRKPSMTYKPLQTKTTSDITNHTKRRFNTKMSKPNDTDTETVYCALCGRPIFKNQALTTQGGQYTCPDCAQMMEYASGMIFSNGDMMGNGIDWTADNTCATDIQEEKIDPKDILETLPTPSQIKAHLDQYVIGQEHTKRTLAVAVYNHYKRILNPNPDVEIEKSNILLVGPTGSGKTYIAKSLAKFMDVPFAIADATTLTEAGYVGDDVENILAALLQNADGDIQACEQGIIYIDEIDKIGRKGENTSITRDVSGEGVQQALLKIIEGTTANIQINAQRKHPNGERIQIDTSNILFICGGAFEGIGKLLETEKPRIGFTSDTQNNKTEKQNITPHILIKYGIMPELIGRLPIISVLDKLTEDDLCKILTEPKNAITKQYQALLEMDGTNLTFTKNALAHIAKQAIQQKTGARGLRSIIERTMEPIMFDLPDRPDIKDVTITEDLIKKTA